MESRLVTSLRIEKDMEVLEPKQETVGSHFQDGVWKSHPGPYMTHSYSMLPVNTLASEEVVTRKPLKVIVDPSLGTNSTFLMEK